MKTRMELWKTYREEIESNIMLHKAVRLSNEKLKILYDRLLSVFPDFQKEFPLEEENIDIHISEVKQQQPINRDQIEKIIDKINETEKDYSANFASIDSLDFSSNQLSDVIQDIKAMSNNKIYAKTAEMFDKTGEIQLEVKNISFESEKNMKINIAIDGPSGSGKSSAARKVADKFKMNYISTGLVYRAIAIHALNNNVDFEDVEGLKNILSSCDITLMPNDVVHLNDQDVSKESRADEVSQGASKVSVFREIRDFALQVMQDAASSKNVIMEGRDTTFKVLPNAELKFYIESTAEVRANRRMKQNQELGYKTDYDEILHEIKERDYRDKNREEDPLHIVDDAHVIDSSNMTLDEVVDEISKYIKELK